MCHKNQIQLHKNCSVDDFNVYMIQTSLVTEENTTCANGATFFVILGPVQGRCGGWVGGRGWCKVKIMSNPTQC